MANFRRTIMEEGLVISKTIKEATMEFTSKDGRVVPAQPRRFIVQVASSATWDKDMGLVDPVILEFKVDDILFNKLKFLNRVKTEYEYTNNGAKAVSIGLIG